MNIIALICARGNSRGIKNKNLLKFNKISLLGHAIKQSFKSKFIKRVIVSTDSIKIAKEAKKYKAEIPFMRPAKLASSKSAEIETWRHAIKNLSAEKKYDYIVSVPTTSPLRSIDDINKCISKAIKGNFDMVFTVTNSTKSPYYNILEIKNNKLQKVCGDKQKIVRRQDSPKCYDLTTVCYVFKPEYILKQKNWLKGKTSFIVIPKERSIDIDDKVDYKIAKILGQKYL
jgi:CMP-N,N'-diacetyllegionaminic acid synthase